MVPHLCFYAKTAPQAPLDKGKYKFLYFFPTYVIIRSANERGLPMTVGEKIQFYRKRIRLSQEELGQRLLVSRQTVSLWEMDKTLPTVDNLLRLKDIFSVSIDDILSKDAPASEGDAQADTAAQDAEDGTPRHAFCYTRADSRAILRRVLMPRIIHGTAFLSLSLLLLLSLFWWNAPELARGIFFGLFPAGLLFFGGRIFVAVRLHRAREKELLASTYTLSLSGDTLTLSVTQSGGTVRVERVRTTDTKLFCTGGFDKFLLLGGQYYLLKHAENGELLAALSEKKAIDPLFPLSVNLFVQAILSLPLAALFAHLGTRADAANRIWTFFFFLPIPAVSIVFGFFRREKRFTYVKNLIAGILMAAVLFLYTALSLIPALLPDPSTPGGGGGGSTPTDPMQAALISMVDEAHPIHVDGKMDEAYLYATPLVMDTFASTAEAFQSYGIARFVWSPTENAVYCFIIVNDADVGPAKYDCTNLCDAPWRADSVELLLDFSESGTVPEGGFGPYAEAGLRLSRGMQYRIDGYTGAPTCNLVEEPEQFAKKKPSWLHPISGQAANVFNSTYRLNEETKQMENQIESTLAQYLGWEWSADDTKIGWGHQSTACGYTAEFRVECTSRTLAAGERVFFDIQGNDMYEASREGFYGANIIFYYTSSVRRQIGSLHSAASRPLYDYLVLTDTVAANEISFNVNDPIMYEMGMKDLTVTEPTA